MGKESNVIACEKFVVTTVEGTPYAYRLELVKSAAFEYGNGCSCVVYCDNRFLHVIDLRYVSHCSTSELFHDWSLNWLISYCDPSCKIERCSDEG